MPDVRVRGTGNDTAKRVGRSIVLSSLRKKRVTQVMRPKRNQS